MDYLALQIGLAVGLICVAWYAGYKAGQLDKRRRRHHPAQVPAVTG